MIDNLCSMNFAPRHGTAMAITKAEAEALALKWGNVTDIYIQATVSDSVKKINSIINQTTKIIYLPVRQGTDIRNFNPELVGPAGCVISPSVPQDFSAGSVNYTVSINGIGSKTYAVTSQVANNPVLEGYYADPEILYSRKNKKFYIYPTSDGFMNWSGTYFKTFSSTNLTNWKDEGVILDLPKDVSWAKTNAWAPCITEKKENDVYKYYYYFVAGGNTGVAVSNNPTGPFIDSGKKLVSGIDPDVYTDTISGKSYLYWGNSTMYAAELNADMISINVSTQKTITPSDGTFREGSYVVKRNEVYYFFWSENDTRSQDYRVRYGTSTSPLGPITIPANNLILSKNVISTIYGTGHNSVLQIPGRDEWYMVYHRFTRPKGITMAGDSAGYFRETCIDRLEFDTNGHCKPVIPTVEGIQPVSLLNGGINATPVVFDNHPKGKVVSTEIYSINGMNINLRNNRFEKGVYILKKIYEKGDVIFEKIFISNQKMNNYIGIGF